MQRPTATIQRARILEISDRARSEAVSLLTRASFVRLDSNQLRRFIAQAAPTGDDIIERAIADAPEESKLYGAPSATRSIAYAKTLFGRLQPYLVRAVSANHAGVFQLRLSGDTLIVFNGSLGPARFEKRPLIVFLEQEPAAFWVGAQSAL